MRERGETKRMLEEELKVLGVAEKGSEKNHMHTTMWFFGMAFRFPILFYLGGSGGNTGQTSLRIMKKGRLCLQNRNSAIYRAVLRYTGVWPRWALSWPESCIAVPAMLVSGLGCLPRPRRADAK